MEFERIWRLFETSRHCIPSFGADVDIDIQRFFDGLKDWVVGMLQ